jgi:hypothetical protein
MLKKIVLFGCPEALRSFECTSKLQEQYLLMGEGEQAEY